MKSSEDDDSLSVWGDGEVINFYPKSKKQFLKKVVDEEKKIRLNSHQLTGKDDEETGVEPVVYQE